MIDLFLLFVDRNFFIPRSFLVYFQRFLHYEKVSGSWGGGDSYMKQTGMLVVSLRVFRAKRQYFKLPRSRLGFRDETQNYAKRNRIQIFFFLLF